MIKNIYFENYKSFKKFNYEIKSYKNSTNLYLIYGENGSGKSNIISSLYLLSELNNSLNFLDSFKEYGLKEEFKKDDFYNLINEYLKSKDISQVLKSAKRIGSKDDMKLKYTFLINDKEYQYKLKFNDEKLIHESLMAPMSKNKVLVYSIDYIDEPILKFNTNLFSKSYEKDIKELIKTYFGKHTLLSIINFELNKKNKDFLKKNIHRTIFDLINYITDMSILYKEGINKQQKVIANHNKLLYNLSSGIINKKHKDKVDKTEESLNIYFKSLYSDIKSVYYKQIPEENNITYELYLRKMIGEEIVSVPFYYESRGTKKLLELFPFFIKLLKGGIVVIDELESGVHDVLISILMEKLETSNIKGQLIATTHNTMLLDIINKDQIYMLDLDDLGNKVIYNLKDSGVVIQPNHSVYNNFIKGAYGGIPVPGYFDFDDLNDCLEDKLDEEKI